MPDTRSSRPTSFRALAVALTLAVISAFLAAVAAPAQADDSPFVVTMTPSSNPVSSGSSLTYTIDVKNAGGDITDDTILNTQISGMTGLILTSNVGGCTQSNNHVTCNGGTLAGQQSWRVTIRGTVTAPNGSTLFNGVTVTGNHESSGYSTSAYSDVLVSNTSSSPLPDLWVSVAGPANIADNSSVTYVLTVNNSGNANAVDVDLIDTLPAGTLATGVTATSLFSCSHDGAQTVECSGGRVNAGSNATITVTADVLNPDSGGAGDPQMKNTAVVDPWDAIRETSELNNTGSLVSVNTPPPAQTGGLTILKTGTPDVLRPGDKITYTLVVANTATTRADNIAVTDVTQGLDAASITATTNRGVCTVTAPKVVCTQKSPTLRLEPGQTMTITIVGTVTSPAGTLITNLGTVTGVIKNKAVTNTSRTTATIKPGVDLTVVQYARTNHADADDTPASTDPFRAWDHFQYDVVVGNSGINTATNVLVREVVAPGVVFLGDAGGLCSQSGGAGQPIRCTIPSLAGVTAGAPGGTFMTITLNVVSPPTPGTIDATVTVDPANTIFEPDETNNVWKVSTPIVTGIDLTVTKTSEDPIAPSGTLTYTITVSNIGTQDATGVTVKDTLPAGTRFRSVQPEPLDSHNFTCSHNGAATGGEVTCVGGRLRGTHDHDPSLVPLIDTVTIVLVVFAPSQPGVIRNQVRVDPAGEIPELLEDNNINSWNTEIKIDGGLHPYHEFNIKKSQVSPNDGATPAAPVPVAPNGIVEYDLVVTNTGSDVAFDVQVDDIMPAGFTFRYAVDTLPGTGDFQCDLVASTIRCTGGTLDGTIGQTAQAGDQTRTIHVSMFSAGQPGLYTNKALVDPNNTHPEADETNNSSQAVTEVKVGGGGKYKDLTIDSLQADPVGDVAPSGTLRYTLDVSNTGTAVAFNVKVRDTLPEGSVFRTAVDSAPGVGAFECTGAGLVVTCTGGTLDGTVNETSSPSTRQIVIEVFAPTEPGNYLNTAVVDPDDAIAENDELNNTDTTPLQVRMGGGGLYRDLTIDDPIVTNVTYGPPDLTQLREPKPSQVYTYTVKATNSGTNPAYNVVVRHVLEDGATFLNATADQDFSCTIAANVVLCDGGVLDGTPGFDPAGPTATFTLTVRAPARHNYVYGLTSRVDPGNAIAEANEANNSRSLNVKAVSQVDLTVDLTAKTGSQGTAGTVEWTAKAAGDDAKNVYVVIELPVGTIPQNMTSVPTGWTCQIEENPINKVTCHGDLVKDTPTTPFKVDTYVTSTATTANAFIDPDNTVVENAEGNNADSIS